MSPGTTSQMVRQRHGPGKLARDPGRASEGCGSSGNDGRPWSIFDALSKSLVWVSLKNNISNEFAQHAASRYPLTASPETNLVEFGNEGRTIIGKIHEKILADFASAVLAWGVHGRTPPPASLRVSAAGRAKALGFPAADRPTAVRISSYTKNIIKVNMN